jgi:hypothetical protein
MMGSYQINEFYQRLDRMVLEEHKLINQQERRKAKAKTNNSIEKQKTELEQFIETMKKELGLPRYSRTLMDRIVVELQNDKKG